MSQGLNAREPERASDLREALSGVRQNGEGGNPQEKRAEGGWQMPGRWLCKLCQGLGLYPKDSEEILKS